MLKLSDNYYLRKCFIETEQVPTQTVMKKTMGPPLAAVYFKSMTHKLKVLAGFEPPMKGGGSDWYQPPKEILGGRAVMKPLKNEYLKKLSYEGIDFLGLMFLEDHYKKMEEEKKKILLENDFTWKKTIETSCRQQWEDSSKEAAKQNTETIQSAFREFTTLYTTSIAKVENILFDAALDEIKSVREDAFDKMKKHYASLMKQQATMLYDRYTDKLMKEKARLKAEFIFNVEKTRTEMNNKIHDVKLEKHIVVEKLRQFLESQNLACQIYVALKEKEECAKVMRTSQCKHKKRIKALKEEIELKDFEIRLEQEKEKKRLEFIRIWQKKMCHVVKKFQMFVSFCLNTLPEHADFFIDTEKLMMLQLSEALENPSAESIFVVEEDKIHTPIPKPHPFYLFCDKGYRPDNIDPNLCPKNCSSSASQLPVIVVNKRCIYAACDNFEKFTDKLTQFNFGRRGDDTDFIDDRDYQYDIPVRVTSTQELLELKLESSLLQVLQKELPNVKKVPIKCAACKAPHCFCSPIHVSKMSLNKKKDIKKVTSLQSIASGNKINARSVELRHEREPKWESYMEYVETKKCKCSKMAKKHLEEHLPPYMRNMSMFDAPDIPNYEFCDLGTLKKLVKAQGKRPHMPPPSKMPLKRHDVSTQYFDQEFELLCTCFSDDEMGKLFKEFMDGNKALKDRDDHFKVIGDNVSLSYLSQRTSSFATERAHSLRNLLKGAPDLEEIFKKNDCTFEQNH